MSRRAAMTAFTVFCLGAAGLYAGEAQTFGKPLKGLKPTPLSEVLAKPVAGQAVCLEGRVEKVCQNKGCWLELKQAASAVKVTFEDYGFFVPKDSAGKNVRLEGVVEVETPSAEEVEHLKKEGASDAAAARVSVVASGVELR